VSCARTEGDKAHDLTSRKFQGIPSLAISPEGRLWATWYASITPDEDQNNYVVVASSGDKGLSWTEKLIIDPDGDGPVRAFDNELHNHRLSSVGAYTELMQDAALNKPVWMVLQGFSWDLLKLKDPKPEDLDPWKFPTYKHSRFMAWDAILHGAKGILYWSSYKVNSNTLFWNSILGVTKEIAALEPFLLGKELKGKIQIEPIQFTSSVKTRVASTLRKHKDDYLLVVLQEDLNQALNISGLDFLEGKTLYELTSDRSYIVKNGKIRVWFGREPHVLCTSKKYDVIHESQFPLTWDKEDNFPLNEI
jgi:hypothetical protein